tara:strand:- start:219 stop:710 length:492 start_codon:yes stop_codon:yes gene_type:complete
MKIETHNIFHLLIFALFYNLTIAQSDVYFLINKNDSLIKLQISNEPKTYAGYRILYDERVKTRRNNTPIQKTSNGEVKVWVEDSKYDYFVYDNPFVSFSFIKEYDKLINKEELNNLKIITKRKEFLKIGEKEGFDGQGNTYFFLEQRKNNKYLMRKVHPVVYE